MTDPDADLKDLFSQPAVSSDSPLLFHEILRRIEHWQRRRALWLGASGIIGALVPALVTTTVDLGSLPSEVGQMVNPLRDAIDRVTAGLDVTVLFSQHGAWLLGLAGFLFTVAAGVRSRHSG